MSRTEPTAATLDTGAMAQTAAFIAAVQEPDGRIPWFPGGHADPWDHVEAAMGLDVAGRHAEADAAYDWLRRNQNPDGSWFRGYQHGHVTDPVREANFAAYLAAGMWHHFLSTQDGAFLDRLWPALDRAVGFVLSLQEPGGQVRWARGADGADAAEALVTGNSSIFHSLRCALAIARYRGEARPGWELAAARLRHAVAVHPERFSPRDRYSMDWYYPILGGAVGGAAAHERLSQGWDGFVVPGLGVRCVSDRPWVTGAETCELVLALCACGRRAAALELFATVSRLRHEDGSYWTGYVYPDDALWPVERTTWTAGAVLLAAAALDGHPATSAVFLGDGLTGGEDPVVECCAGYPLRRSTRSEPVTDSSSNRPLASAAR
jgi:hypothetical protein